MIQDICREKTVLYLCQFIFGSSPDYKKTRGNFIILFLIWQILQKQTFLFPVPPPKKNQPKKPAKKQCQTQTTKMQNSWGSLIVTYLGTGVEKAKRVWEKAELAWILALWYAAFYTI